MIKKIQVHQLKAGMYIADLNNQWVPSNNASRSGLVKFETVVEKVKGLGIKELYIDTERGIDCPEGEPVDSSKQLQAQQFKSIATQSGTQASTRAVPLSEERKKAEEKYSKAKSLIGDLLEDAKLGKAINADAVEDTANDLIQSLNSNENALACLTFIRSKDEYLLEHSLNVGLLLGIFGRSRRIDGDTLRQLVAGGMLHDIGKVLVPAEVLHKPDKLDADEWEEMKRHVTYGEQILDVTKGLSETTRSICSLHHERMDGTGYPRNLQADDITEYGRMSAICDVYDAVTADRVYRKGMSPNNALKKLIEWSIFHLDKELVYDFIRCLSVYPVGTVVQISNGHAGVIIEANRRQPKMPKLRLFYDTAAQKLITPIEYDLALSGAKFDIVNTLDARQLGVDIRPYL